MAIQPKKCEVCNVEFLPAYRVTEEYWQGRRFCSPRCTQIASRGKRRPTFGKAMVTLEHRFWSKVNKDGPIQPHCQHLGPCWVWTGATTMDGYGYLFGTRREHRRLAHRLSYELNIGPIPNGLCVLHKCDNEPCVNPGHLFTGTRKDNNEDKIRKGRDYDRHGASNPNASLTQDDADEIRAMRARGMTQQAIADAKGTPQSNVSKILRNLRWVRT
jgi:hypothetical protein